jgi:hypothetical protein
MHAIIDLDALVQDLLAHAHEAPAQCAALMRRAAGELRARQTIGGKHRRPTTGECDAPTAHR